MPASRTRGVAAGVGVFERVERHPWVAARVRGVVCVGAAGAEVLGTLDAWLNARMLRAARITAVLTEPGSFGALAQAELDEA
jgi:hypothetical protein